MAVPLRKVANGYPDVVAQPYRQPLPPAGGKRLAQRQIQSRSSYRSTVAIVLSTMAFVLFLMGLSYIFVKAGVTRMNWEVNQLTAQNESAMMENERLKGEIAGKKSLERIEAIATQELGMVKEADIQYMVLSDTVVAEGKIRPVETTETIETAPSPLAAVVDFILALK